MSDSQIIVGYSIIDPDGHYPSTPEYGIGCLDAARQEALALNEDFASSPCSRMAPRNTSHDGRQPRQAQAVRGPRTRTALLHHKKKKSASRAGVGPPLEKKAGHHVLLTGERPMNELHPHAARRPRLFVTSEENSS